MDRENRAREIMRRESVIVAMVLGGLALSMVVIVTLATNGDGSGATGNAAADQSTPRAEDEFNDCARRAPRDSEIPRIPVDVAQQLTSGRREEEGFGNIVLYDTLLKCVDEGALVVEVDGLPGVSGLYTSKSPNVGVSGLASWSPGDLPDPRLPNLGDCYLNDPGTPHHTKLVRTREGGLEEVGRDAFTEVITVDIGTTVEGDPFFAVVREVGVLLPIAIGSVASSPLSVSEVTHNYSEALPPDSGLVDAVQSAEFFALDDRKAFTGMAIFKVKSFNTHDYFPWTDSSQLGAAVYDGTITVWCRGGTTLTPPTTTTSTLAADGTIGMATVGDRSYLFTVSGADRCTPDQGGLFVVEASGEDETGRQVSLSITAPHGAGFAVVEIGDPTGESELWVADLNVYGEYPGQNPPSGVGATADIAGDTMSGSGQFYEARAMEEAFANRSSYDGPTEHGTFEVDCSGR